MTANYPPDWIMSMLHAKFHELCRGGDPKCKPCTYFCKDCDSNKVFCKTCKSKHEGHKVLQVFRAPQTALQLEDMESLFDVSNISHRTNHGEKVVFLHSKQKESQASQDNPFDTSHECGCQLSQNRDSIKFCSIACKVQSIRNSTVPLTAVSSVEFAGSGRKKNRKGAPMRSPFF